MENKENEGSENIKEKMNLTNIIINNTNKMNINNINIKNSYFRNLIPQKILSEAHIPNIINKKFQKYLFNENGQEYYLIKKENNFSFNNEITKYISQLCIKAIDFYSNAIWDKKHIKEITTKNIIKYLNDIIKAEWLVLIDDLNEKNNFEFSLTNINEMDIIIFKYKNYKIYIILLFLILNTDFQFEIPKEEKIIEQNIIKKEDDINIKNNEDYSSNNENQIELSDKESEKENLVLNNINAPKIQEEKKQLKEELIENKEKKAEEKFEENKEENKVEKKEENIE